MSCPDLSVVSNTWFRSLSQFRSEGNPSSAFRKNSFPRIGTFEIYFRGQIIFSKLREGRWPNSNVIAEKIRNHVDGIVLAQKSDSGSFVPSRAFTANSRSRSAKNIQGVRNNEKPLKSGMVRGNSEVFQTVKPDMFKEDKVKESAKKNHLEVIEKESEKDSEKLENSRHSAPNTYESKPITEKKIIPASVPEKEHEHPHSIIPPKREDNREDSDKRLSVIQSKLKEEESKFMNISGNFVAKEDIK